jgi:hypothetical protein
LPVMPCTTRRVFLSTRTLNVLLLTIGLTDALRRRRKPGLDYLKSKPNYTIALASARNVASRTAGAVAAHQFAAHLALTSGAL